MAASVDSLSCVFRQHDTCGGTRMSVPIMVNAGRVIVAEMPAAARKRRAAVARLTWRGDMRISRAAGGAYSSAGKTSSIHKLCKYRRML